MKTLLSTTALVIALGLPTLALAQTQAPVANPANEQQTTGVSGFLAGRSQSDLFASELMGHDVYARTTAADATTQGNADAVTGVRTMATVTATELAEMETIGQINEIVLSNDGQVRALVIGIGGFLGMGEQDVAVTMDQVSFASGADDPSEMVIIVTSGVEALRQSPAFDRTSMMDDRASEARDDRTAFAAPRIERDGYTPVEALDVSTEMLTGKTVYDVNDTDVGTVTDMLVDDTGAITDVIIDFGGFLGMGVSQAALSYDELTILSTDGYAEVRLYVDATKAQIQDLPAYQAAN